VCVSCTDGLKNGAETDKDCGGGTCQKCDDGATCGSGADCKSDTCTGTTCETPAKASLVMWLKADAITGLADGAAVAAWSDASGQNNNTAQATVARRPVYKTNVVNGKPVVRFDGADDALAITSTKVLASFSVFIVYRFASGATAAGNYYPFIFGGTVNVTGTYFGIETLNAAAGTSADVLDAFGGFSNDARATATNISAYNQWKLISIVVAGSTHKATVRVNGVDAVMTTTGTDVTYAVPLGSAAGTGGSGTSYGGPSVYAMKGDIAELVVHDQALAAGPRKIVEDWLNAKYAIY
jgi:hypothetical protein